MTTKKPRRNIQINGWEFRPSDHGKDGWVLSMNPGDEHDDNLPWFYSREEAEDWARAH